MEFKNPYKPGAGHTPPYLAGRRAEKKEFEKLLGQTEILDNFLLTGLRGVGKTVLSDELKPIAINKGWIVVGSDLSETVSVSEENLAIRIMADIAVMTSSLVFSEMEFQKIGIGSKPEKVSTTLNFNTLRFIYEQTPGLTADKLKAVLETVHSKLPVDRKRVIFCYDEAQNLADNAKRNEYPLSVLLDVFQSIQKKGIPFMLMLIGLPTLFPKLVDARTFAERMFRVVFLKKLSVEESKAAIRKPLENSNCPIKPTPESIDLICDLAGGYPYFLQFIGRELYDVWVIDSEASIPIDDISNKLDSDFFAGRWDRASDRQRELLSIIASLDSCSEEFSVQEIVVQSKSTDNPFSSSHVNQMLSNLTSKGLIYKNRYGKYSFSVPLLDRFIKRQPCFIDLFFKINSIKSGAA